MILRKAFTLIELLVVVAILGTMITIGVVSIQSGQDVSRTKGAMRDVYATIRHARSMALVIGKPIQVTYANEKVNDTSAVRISVKIQGGDKLMAGRSSQEPIQPYFVKKYQELVLPSAEDDATSQEGETLEDVLLAEMDQDLLTGVRVKVVMSENSDQDETEAQRANRLSVSSTASGMFESRELKTEPTEAKTDDEPMDAPVSVVWQTNGVSEPHVVWLYREEQKPEDGLVLKVDRYGGIKILEGKELME